MSADDADVRGIRARRMTRDETQISSVGVLAGERRGVNNGGEFGVGFRDGPPIFSEESGEHSVRSSCYLVILSENLRKKTRN